MKPTTVTKLVQIGNSRGVRIPKAVIEQLGLEGALSLSVTPDGLVIRPVRHPREGWAEQARAMVAAGDDILPEGNEWPATEWDETEWEW